MATSKLTIVVQGKDDPPDPYSGAIQVSATRSIASVGDGSGDNQMQVLLAKDSDDDGTIATSSTVDIDLTNDEDRFGVAAALDDVMLIYLYNKTDTGSPANIRLEPGSGNSWDQLLVGNPGGTDTPGVELKPGAWVVFGLPIADDYDVNGGSAETLQIRNTSGSNVAEYEMQIWGRRA